jgi:hypothetical protein
MKVAVLALGTPPAMLGIGQQGRIAGKAVQLVHRKLNTIAQRTLCPFTRVAVVASFRLSRQVGWLK